MFDQKRERERSNGSVLAIDLEPNLLNDVNKPNVEVRGANVRDLASMIGAAAAAAAVDRPAEPDLTEAIPNDRRSRDQSWRGRS